MAPRRRRPPPLLFSLVGSTTTRESKIPPENFHGRSFLWKRRNTLAPCFSSFWGNSSILKSFNTKTTACGYGVKALGERERVSVAFRGVETRELGQSLIPKFEWCCMSVEAVESLNSLCPLLFWLFKVQRFCKVRPHVGTNGPICVCTSTHSLTHCIQNIPLHACSFASSCTSALLRLFPLVVVCGEMSLIF